MNLFRTSALSYVGVDIGASGIKVVELANSNGRPRLVTYGILETKFDTIGRVDPRDRPEEISRFLLDILSRSHVTTTKAITALPTFSVFSSIMTMAPLPAKELASAVRWEAKKIIPMPLEEMILDYKVLGEFLRQASGSSSSSVDVNEPQSADSDKGIETQDLSSKKKLLKILLTAAAKELVTKYVQIFEKSKLTLLSLETEAFALVRSLVGVDPTTVMIVDMGAVNTDISIIDNSLPVLNRSIDLGGAALSRALSQQLKLSETEAEQYKRDVGLPVSPDTPLPECYSSTLGPIVNEIRYTTTLYQRQLETLGLNQSVKIEKIILTGGSAFLPGLAQYLTAQLNIKTYIGDPWARVIIPQDLRPTLTELGPRLGIAVGLAMRNIQ